MPPYPPGDYAADLARLSGGRNDPDLTDVLVHEAHATVRWLHRLGLRYRLMYERQAYERPDGSFLFFGGLHIGNVGGGQGLMADHRRAAELLGVAVRHSSAVTELLVDGGRVVGVRGTTPGGPAEWRAESVVLAAGGFEADPTRRREHLGPGWEHARVRGTPHDTGEVLAAALCIGAAKGGDWASAHSVQWDAWHPDNEGNRELTNRLTGQSYPLGIIVNRDGRRFVDEGADFRNYTYARYGRAILEQPGSIAFQLFDGRLRPLLRSEERLVQGGLDAAFITETLPSTPVLTATTAGARLIDIDGPRVDSPDGEGRLIRRRPTKSNWASPLDQPPFYAYPVTCGITFTFGGLRGDRDGRVLDQDGQPLPGLFVRRDAGRSVQRELPRRVGLAAGMVFGRRAGLRA